MDNKVSSLGQGPGLAWKRASSSFPPGSLAELQEFTGGTTEPPEPPWHGEVDFQQWNTIGWGVTNDGILCIKPWKGSAGETGPSTDEFTPWYDYDQSSNIKKVESTGTIVLNEYSQNLFYECSNLTDLTGLANWTVSKVTSMFGMFDGCSGLTDLTPLEHWNVSNAMNMVAMFSRCSSLTALTAIADWDVSSVTNMSAMFSRCSSLTALTALADWDVSNVMAMESMFSDCSNLTDLTAIKNWNLSNVMNMRDMFQGCSEIQKIGIPSITNGGEKLVANAEAATLTTVLPSIVSEDGSMGPYTWDELNIEMTSNPDAFQEGTVWLKEVR